MKVLLDTDLVPIIVPNTYGSEFQYYVINGEWDRLKKVMIDKAKEYITATLRHDPQLGHGHGPLNHVWRLNP